MHFGSKTNTFFDQSFYIIKHFSTCLYVILDIFSVDVIVWFCQECCIFLLLWLWALAGTYGKGIFTSAHWLVHLYNSTIEQNTIRIFIIPKNIGNKWIKVASVWIRTWYSVNLLKHFSLLYHYPQPDIQHFVIARKSNIIQRYQCH